MFHLRATHKVLRLLDRPSPSEEVADTALGDWFVNRFVVERKPYLILVSSASLLPILEPARRVRSLPRRLAEIVGGRLRRLGIADDLVQAEVAAMDEARIASTNDRSVLGTMVDFVNMLRYYPVDERGWSDDDLRRLERWLEQTPCRSSRAERDVLFPVPTTRDLLARHSDLVN